MAHSDVNLQERYELAINGSREGLWDWNLYTNELYLSPRWKEILGYQDDELKNEFASFENNIHPHDFSNVMDSVKKHFSSQDNGIDLIIRMKHKDGHYKWIHDKGKAVFNKDGKPTRMVGFHSDVDDFMKAKKRLSLLEHAYENTNDAIFIVDTKTFNFIDANTVSSIQLGYSNQELLNMSTLDIKHNMYDISALEDRLEQIKRHGTILFKDTHKRKNGTTFPVEIHAILIPFEGEEYLVSTVRDLTKEEGYIEKLKDALLKAEDANLSKSTFLANMSHEIRTPMNVILGFSELLSKSDLQENELKQLDVIHSSARSLLTLINDILDLSKIESGKMSVKQESVNLSKVTDDMDNLFNLKFQEKNLSFNIINNVDKNVKLDEIRLKQILQNLISNAIKFTDNGGITLDISISKENSLKIKVIDTGVGVDKEQHKHIFEAFEQQLGQEYRTFGGTGLGLSISKKLAKLMGGDLYIKPNIPKGSKFIAEFYNIQTLETIEDLNNETDEDIQLPNIKVLIVDDIMTNRLLLDAYFDDTNVETIEASNGLEAIEMAKEHMPNLILMDIKMPIMDGIQATKILKQDPSTKHIHISALTADIVNKEKDTILKDGFDYCLTKPISKDELFTGILEILNTKEGVNTTV